MRCMRYNSLLASKRSPAARVTAGMELQKVGWYIPLTASPTDVPSSQEALKTFTFILH